MKKSSSSFYADLPMTPEILRHWLALLRIKGIGPAKFFALLEHCSDIIELFKSSAALLVKYGIEAGPDWQAVDRDLAWMESSKHHHIIAISDARYPPLLRETVNPPPLLFVAGQVAALTTTQFAIVGSRNPSPAGVAITFDFAQSLAASGLTITSGLALGIDAAAHRGALKSGVTIAVLGTGLDLIYPKQHAKLAQAIVEQGALISEFQFGTPPLPENFPRRNRIVSGMSIGTLVTEATLQSGSLITGRLANEQGREVFAIPGSIHNPLARGCHALLKQGAKLVETLTDIVEELTHFTALSCPVTPASTPPSATAKLDEPHLKLLQCVGYESTGIDQIVAHSGVAVDKVASMLLLLELTGNITSAPGGYLRVTYERKHT